MTFTNTVRGPDVIDIKDYGAVGDGQVDDQTAVQRAFNFAAALGRTLLVSPGRYYVSAPQVPDGSSIFGYGADSIFIRRPDAATNRVLHLSGSNITIDSVTIDGNGSYPGLSNDGTIQANGVGHSNIEIRNCIVQNTRTHAIRLTDTAGNIRIVDNVIQYGSAAGGYGIIMNSQTGGAPAIIDDVKVTGNTIVRHPDCPAGYGMMIRGSDDLVTRTMTNVRVADNSVDLVSVGGLGIEVWADHANITANIVRNGNFGISRAGSHGVIVGNDVANVNGPGIEIAVGSNVTAEANAVYQCLTGIGAWNGSTSARIVGNDIGRCEPAIHCYSHGATVNSNGISVYTSGGTITIGIWLQGAQDVTVNDNEFLLELDNVGTNPVAIQFSDVEDFTCNGNLLAGEGGTFDKGVHVVATTVTTNGSVVGNNLRHAAVPYDETVSGSGAIGDIKAGLNVGIP